MSLLKSKTTVPNQWAGRDPSQSATVEVDKYDPVRIAIASFLGVVLFVLMLVLLGFATRAYGRYQTRQDRNLTRQQRIYDEQNGIQVNKIRIAQQDQLVKVAQQKADIRYENAIGVRKAQDEISNTLTPLYVQFEMTQALQEIATSGKNNTVIYLPTNPANGLPAVTLTNPAVAKP